MFTVVADEQGMIYVRCPFCSRDSMKAAKLFPLHQPVNMDCSCGNTYEFQIETRKEYRKKTKIKGFYVKPDLHSAFEPIIIIDLTLGGCCFLAPDNHALHHGDAITLHFRLDDPARTILKRPATVVRVVGNVIGCKLITGAYDPALGFYVQDFKVSPS